MLAGSAGLLVMQDTDADRALSDFVKQEIYSNATLTSRRDTVKVSCFENYVLLATAKNKAKARKLDSAALSQKLFSYNGTWP